MDGEMRAKAALDDFEERGGELETVLAEHFKKCVREATADALRNCADELTKLIGPTKKPFVGAVAASELAWRWNDRADQAGSV